MIRYMFKKVIQVWSSIDPTDQSELPAVVNGAALYLDALDSDKPKIKYGAATIDLTAAGGGLDPAATTADKQLVALATVADGNAAIGSAISATPAKDSFVTVHANGHAVPCGPGLDCYFSGDGGTTPRAQADITVGDTLHWNGSIAQYQLTTADRIDLAYEV